MVTVTVTFDLLTLKSIGSIYGSWQFMIPRKVQLGEISLPLMSRQAFANVGYRLTDQTADRGKMLTSIPIDLINLFLFSFYMTLSQHQTRSLLTCTPFDLNNTHINIC